MQASKGNKPELTKKAGRPQKWEYTQELGEAICEEIAAGASIRKLLEENPDKYPGYDTFRKWRADTENGLNDLYINAVQDKSDFLIEKMDRITKKLEDGEIEPAAANVIIQTEKWKAAKFYPKMYGDKQTHELTGKGGSKLYENIEYKVVLEKYDGEPKADQDDE